MFCMGEEYSFDSSGESIDVSLLGFIVQAIEGGVFRMELERERSEVINILVSG